MCGRGALLSACHSYGGIGYDRTAPYGGSFHQFLGNEVLVLFVLRKEDKPEEYGPGLFCTPISVEGDKLVVELDWHESPDKLRGEKRDRHQLLIVTS